MAIFGVWAFRDGTSIWALLVVRFGIAAVLLGALMRIRGIRLPAYRRLLVLAAMGGLGYVGQSFCYFLALQHAQAGLVALLLYLSPTFVVVLAAVFLRDRLPFAVLAALVLALAGTSLVVGGGCGRPLGIAVAVGAAVIYSIYITVGVRATAGLDPLAVTTVVCCSAAVVSAGAALAQTVRGEAPTFPGSAAGWAALLAIAVVCSVLAILAFFAGLQRLGAARTAVLSTLEPVVTVGLAVWLLAETMSSVQVIGGALVLVAVVWQATVRHGGTPPAVAAAVAEPTSPEPAD
jgi:drug/metabolite transporter (DMT)-like permease